VLMGDAVRAATDEFKDFMFARVYGGVGAGEGLHKVAEVVGNLFRHYMDAPQDLPGGRIGAESQRDLARRVCDYVAGMTDRYAKLQFIAHFLPEDWRAA